MSLKSRLRGELVVKARKDKSKIGAAFCQNETKDQQE